MFKSNCCQPLIPLYPLRRTPPTVSLQTTTVKEAMDMIYPDMHFKELLGELARNEHWKSMTEENMFSEKYLENLHLILNDLNEKSKNTKLKHIYKQFFLNYWFSPEDFNFLFDDNWGETESYLELVSAYLVDDEVLSLF